MTHGLRNLCCVVLTVMGLVLIAHERGKPAGANAPGSTNPDFSMDSGFSYAIAPEGEIYRRPNESGQPWESAVYVGNSWGDASPTAITPSTWSEIKGQCAPIAGGGN